MHTNAPNRDLYNLNEFSPFCKCYYATGLSYTFLITDWDRQPQRTLCDRGKRKKKLENEVIEAPVSQPEVIAEKTFTEEQVNKIAGRARQEAADRTRKQLEQEYAKREAERQANAIGNQSESMGGMSTGVDTEQIKRQVYEQIMAEARGAQEQQAQEQHKAAMEKVAATYHQKMAQGKDLHADFDEAMADFDVSAFPKLAFLVSDLDNAASVMYELSKNPMKLGSINNLVENSPPQALKALKSLSASIQQNQQGMSQASPSAPLSRMKSSVTAGADSGEMSVASFKKQPWLRG